QIGLMHLARVDAALHARAGDIAGIGQRHANRAVLARVAHDVAQPLDAVALHQAHRAGVVVRPHRLGAARLRGTDQPLGDLVEGVVPGDRLIRGAAHTAGADAAQRYSKAVWVMDALGVAADLRAHDTRRVRMLRRAAHATDAARVETLDLQRADAGTVMRA